MSDDDGRLVIDDERLESLENSPAKNLNEKMLADGKILII